MKNFLSKILYVILALIILICIFIGVCAVNPDVAEPFKEMAANVEETRKRKAREAEEAEAEAQAAQAASVEEVEEETAEEEEPEEEPDIATGPETAHPYDFDLTYQDYVDDWADTSVNDDYKNNPDYEEFVKDFLNPEEDEDGDFPEDSSHMLTPQPEIIDVEDEDQAQEIMDSVDYGETGEGLEFDELYYPYYHMLNEKCQALYRQIYANANALNEQFAPITEATSRELQDAFCCVLDDHPELFWVDITFYTEYDYKGNVIKFNFDFYKNFSDIPSARDKFENTAKELSAGAQGLGSAYEKELYIHDLIVNKLNYRFNSLDQSAYSSVVQNETVCAGYARCFQYLMQLLQVPTYNCSGWGGRERHAWNIIKLDDGFHNVDCTWDDSLSNYDYFNLSDAENDSHRRMEFSVYLPPCVSSEYRPEAEASEYEEVVYGEAVGDGDTGVPGTENGNDDETTYVIQDGGADIIIQIGPGVNTEGNAGE